LREKVAAEQPDEGCREAIEAARLGSNSCITS